MAAWNTPARRSSRRQGRRVRAGPGELCLALVCLGAFTGCGTGGDGNDGGDDGRVEENPSVATTTEPTEVVAEAEWGYENEEGNAAVEVHALRIHGDLMDLHLTITGGEDTGGSKETVQHLLGTPDPYLVDSANANRHRVIEDASGSPVNSSRYTDLPPGEPRDITFTFPAPPESVEVMDLYAYDEPPVRDVPVVR